ncbi:MAG: LptF/LptG family permease [Planctomycetes bacterium]|nr:LptF/LptG family permease [Planctomycetota bacterium]
MKKLDLYILKLFLSALGVAALVLIGLYVVIHLFSNLADFMEVTQQNFFVFVVQYYFYRFPLVLQKLLPIITLIAAVMTITRLARNNELTPIFAGGISIYRALLPVVVVAGILSAGMFAMDETLVSPLSKNISRTDKILKSEGSERFVSRQTPHYNIAMKKYNYISRIMMDVWITEYNDEKRLNSKITARQAAWTEQGDKSGVATAESRPNRGWLLSDGIIYNYDVSAYPMILRKGPPQPFGAKGYFLKPELMPEDMEKTADAQETLSAIQELLKQYPQRPDLKIKYHNKFAFPLTNVVLIFLGVPLILMGESKKFSVGIGICLAVGLGFFVFKFLLENLGDKGVLPPLVAAWAPIIISIGAIIYLMKKIRT